MGWLCNEFILKINKTIADFNEKIENKEKSLNEIKDFFWDNMRWDYDQTISNLQKEQQNIASKITELNSKVSEVDVNISSQNITIKAAQKDAVNIEEAVENINQNLSDFGVSGFKIVKYNDKYRISRDVSDSKTFHSLSEGEKMIISFLYFHELCKGKKTASEVQKNKIVIIDDPISSLSHIHIFSIGELIKRKFFDSNFEQVFILTHSLYFFYELTFIKKEKRSEFQKLFRLSKNLNGSQILPMKYEEIQNDYQAYWNIVKDSDQPPALIAKCMRNIIEHFFGFIEKNDLGNVFQKPELKNTRYQAFYRYINRESHSLSQNIFDIKEFNYNDFKEAFELVFKTLGYEDHYKRMSQ